MCLFHLETSTFLLHSEHKPSLTEECNFVTDEEEDIRLLVKTLPSKHTPALPMQEEVSTTVVYDLLNCLIKPAPEEDSTVLPGTSIESDRSSGSGKASTGK